MDDLLKDPFAEYIRQTDSSVRMKGYAWQTAIGLQKVDGIETSEYLLKTAKRNIEGEITVSEAQALLDSYYRENSNHAPGNRTEEADKVSARITEILSENAFNFTPAQYISIHKRLFNGIYEFAGKIRDYNISKKEWVLNGDTVTYASCYNIKETLEYDFEAERKFSYNGLSEKEIISHIARFISNLWQIHIFGEGNTRTTAVFLIKYLRLLGYDTTNNAFAANAWYFRNALVRANYNDLKNNISETTEYLELFLRNLLLNENNILHNRNMHISGYLDPEKQDIDTQKQDIDTQKQDIDTEKQDIDTEKQDIDTEKQDIDTQKQDIKIPKDLHFTQHTEKNIRKLYETFGTLKTFGRADISDIVNISSSPASELIKKMLSADLIIKVPGQGKGKYKFR